MAPIRTIRMVEPNPTLTLIPRKQMDSNRVPLHVLPMVLWLWVRIFDQETPRSYEVAEEYRVTRSVMAEDQSQQSSLLISVGRSPAVSILLPAKGVHFSVGEVLMLQGEAFVFRGQRLVDDQLQWEVRQHHGDHWHPPSWMRHQGMT